VGWGGDRTQHQRRIRTALELSAVQAERLSLTGPVRSGGPPQPGIMRQHSTVTTLIV
jgi:hypothetical protein